MGQVMAHYRLGSVMTKMWKLSGLVDCQEGVKFGGRGSKMDFLNSET